MKEVCRNATNTVADAAHSTASSAGQVDPVVIKSITYAILQTLVPGPDKKGLRTQQPFGRKYCPAKAGHGHLIAGGNLVGLGKVP